MEQQNIAYYPHENVQRNGDSQDHFQLEFHPSSNANFQVSNERNFGHSSRNSRTSYNARQHVVVQQTPVPLPQKSSSTPVHVQLVPQGSSPLTSQQQHIIISSQPIKSTTPNSDSEGNPITAFMEYFVEQQQPGCSSSSNIQNIQTMPQYRTPIGETKYVLKSKLLSTNDKNKTEKDALKRAKQAEAARLRYHRLTAEEKKVLNLKRTLAQKRKKQREKEMAQLEAILRASGDIYDDPEVLEQLREKRMRAKWAEAARNRYQRMSEEERRSHNMRRRMKQITTKTEGTETLMDEETQRRIKEQNEKKAEAARLRYHRMSTDEKKMYNQRRTEAFRRRRMEEEALLAMPIGRINGEALDRAQQIVIRNAKRAEAARLRYQRMTPEQRRAYNQKRYTPKRKRQVMAMIIAETDGDDIKLGKTEGEEEFDALSSLERDVLRRTQQAQQALLRQRAQHTPQIIGTTPAGGVVLQSTGSTATHFIQQPGTHQSTNEVPQQIQYISASGSTTGTRILMSGSQPSAQQVNYVTTASSHHTRT